MNRLNCAIIKDLIPSYLDDICSEESRKAVEAHLSECSRCREYMENMNYAELSAERTEQTVLQHMKKVKQYYARKNALGALLLFGPVLIILPVIARPEFTVENKLYFILFSVLALGSCLLLSNYQTRPKTRRPAILCITSAALGVIYSTGVVVVLHHCLKTGTGTGGRALSDMGSVLNFRLILIVILQLLVFAGCALDSVKKEYAFGILPALNLTCCFLCMCHRNILFYMDSASTILQTILLNIWEFLLLTAGILLAEYALLRIRRRLEKKALGQ